MFKKLKDQVVINEKKAVQLEESKLTPSEIRINNLLETLEDTIKGGLADSHTPESIARKHGVPLKQILNQISIGMRVETEHTHDPKKAREIAMDHLIEFPDYYDRLDVMEKKAEKELKEYYILYEEILAELALPKDPEYGIKDKKLFPLCDKKYVLVAIRTFNLVGKGDEAKLAKAIIKKMVYHGIRKSSVPEDSKLYPYVKDNIKLAD